MVYKLVNTIEGLNNWDQTVITEAIFLASQKVFVEDPGKDLDKVVLGSFPRSFRIFNLKIKGSFAYLAKIFIDLSRFSDRSWSKCLPRSLKFLYRCCYDLQKSLRILYKTTWWFQKVPLKGSFVCIAKIFIDLWSFFYRFCSKGLPRSLKFLYRSCNDLQKSLRILFRSRKDFTWFLETLGMFSLGSLNFQHTVPVQGFSPLNLVAVQCQPLVINLFKSFPPLLPLYILVFLLSVWTILTSSVKVLFFSLEQPDALVKSYSPIKVVSCK